MKMVLTVTLFLGTSCLFLLAQTNTKATVAGSWKGTFADSVRSGSIAVTLVQGSNGDVLGNYKASSGGTGTVVGNIHSGILEFILTQKTLGCLGSFTGKLTFDGSGAFGTFWGNDCNGRHNNGVISLNMEIPETLSGDQSSNSPATATSDYVACGARTVYVWKASVAGTVVEELKEGTPVVVDGPDGGSFKVKTQSGKVGYITKGFACKKADYEARMSKSPSDSTATDSKTSLQSAQPSQPAIPPGTLLAVAWRAQPWTTTTYYQQPGSSNTDCTGSGSWVGSFWNGSASCTSTYTPAQNIPITWTHYTIYNLVETADSWMVLSCTSNWAFSQCRYLVPGESFSFDLVKGQARVIGQKKVKFNIVAIQPKTSR
jgi:hypothetical protein